MLICFLTAGERILHAFFHNTYSSSHMFKKTFNVIFCTTLRVAHKWESVPIPTPSPCGPTLYPTHHHMPQHHSHPITICPNTLLIPIPYAPTPYPKHHHVPQHIAMCLITIPTPSPCAPKSYPTHQHVLQHYTQTITMLPNTIPNHIPTPWLCAWTPYPSHHHVPQHHPYPFHMCPNHISTLSSTASSTFHPLLLQTHTNTTP